MTFIRNAWYLAAWSDEVTNAPLSRMILGEPVALFRARDGAIAALRDACPHRAVPLSLGTIINDHIRCPYHGLEFDREGICRLNPHIDGPPDRLKTRCFPIAEKHGGLWLWMGDAAAATLNHS